MNILNRDFEFNRKTLSVIKNVLITILRIMFLLAVGYIIIYPLLHMIVTSVKDEAAFYDSAKIWIPSAFNISFSGKPIFVSNSLAKSNIPIAV